MHNLPPFLAAAFPTPARIIATAAIVSVLVQFLKTYFPNVVTGKVTMVVNLLGSIAGVLAIVRPEQVFTIETLQQIIVIFSGASGIHATARGLFNQPDKESPDVLSASPDNTARKAFGLILAVALLSFASLTGCVTAKATTPATAPALPHFAVDQVDAKANQTLQAIHAFLGNVSSDVQAGKLQLSDAQLATLNKTNDLANKADAAEQAYHAAGGGDASILNAALSAAQSAFGNFQSLIAASVTPATK